MSGMTGYDQAASYSTSQYSYVPNLPSATGGNGLNGQTAGGGVPTGDPNGSLGDPRQLHQWHHGGYHQPTHGMQMAAEQEGPPVWICSFCEPDHILQVRFQ